MPPDITGSNYQISLCCLLDIAQGPHGLLNFRRAERYGILLKGWFQLQRVVDDKPPVLLGLHAEAFQVSGNAETAAEVPDRLRKPQRFLGVIEIEFCAGHPIVEQRVILVTASHVEFDDMRQEHGSRKTVRDVEVYAEGITERTSG